MLDDSLIEHEQKLRKHMNDVQVNLDKKDKELKDM